MRLIILSLCLILLALSTDAAQSLSDNAQTFRIALVIGNANYKVGPLHNPVNDAVDMGKALKGVGFKVTLLTNRSATEMVIAIRNFGDDLSRTKGIGLFYFSGHGMQVKGKNYLIPIGANIRNEDEIKFNAIDVGLIMEKMESAGNIMNMVFLDACRDNPFSRQYKSTYRGLAPMVAPIGSLIAYATAPGSVASDGRERNGIFTKYLLKHIRKPGVEIGKMLRNVRKDVLRETNNKQVPWDLVSLTREFYFISEIPEPPYYDKLTWMKIKNSVVIQDFIDYLESFPHGGFVTKARIKIRQLESGYDKLTWMKIKNSVVIQDFIDYLESFPHGRFVTEARIKIRQLESGHSSNTVWHFSAVALSIAATYKSIDEAKSYNELKDRNAVIKEQYKTASAFMKNQLNTEFEENQTKMTKHKDNVQIFDGLTALFVVWEGYLIWSSLSGNERNVSSKLDDGYIPKFTVFPERKSLTAKLSWRLEF
jgi:hypothetical protein